MRALAIGLALAALVVLLLVPASGAPFGGAPAALPAPRAPLHLAGSSATAPSPVLAQSAASAQLQRGTGKQVSVDGSPHPHWSGTKFFTDVNVTFTIPGVLPNPDYNFNYTPYIDQVPMWTNFFWMNISTDVPITYAYVTIWGYTQYPNVGQNPNLTNYQPSHPTPVQLWRNPATQNHTASFLFNDYENFWPGSVIFFNLTVASVSSSPSIIYSTYGAYYPYPGTNDLYTWQYQVGSPWSSTVFANNIQVSSTPSVFGSPAYDPNPFQPFVLTLNSFNQTGGPANPIPMAQANVCVTTPPNVINNEPVVNCFAQDFSPANSTVMSLPPLGPYPGENVSFSLEAWLPWQGSNHAIDFLFSNVSYNFSWSKNGQWWHQGSGLLANANLAAYPDVLGSPATTLPTATAVNVTVLSPTPNVTIGSAQLDFRYSDSEGYRSGVLPFVPVTTNYSYVVIPGLPDDGTLTFYVQAKDIFGNVVSSGNYTYFEKGAISTAGTGSGSFFFEGLNVVNSELVAGLNFTISNATWSESNIGTPLGFGAPYTPGVQPYPNYLTLAYGTYGLSIRCYGQTQNATVAISSATPQTIVFFCASAPVSPSAVTSFPTFTVAAIAGAGAAALTAIPISMWFRERRRKAEEEQRRVTL